MMVWHAAPIYVPLHALPRAAKMAGVGAIGASGQVVKWIRHGGSISNMAFNHDL
jgi:hypothetical protein